MKLRIQPRVLTGFVIMIFLILVLCVFAVLYTNRLQENSARILDENVYSLKAAEELEIALLDMKGLTAYFILDGEQKWLDLFNEKKRSFRTWLAEARGKAHTSAEETLLDSIEVQFQQYLENHTQVVQYYHHKNFNAAHILLIGKMRDTFNQIYEKCEEILTINEKLMIESGNIMASENRVVNIIMYGIGIAGIILGISLGIILARSITHPIYNLVLKVKSATGSDLIEKVDISPETELEHLDKYVRDLIEKIQLANRDLEHSQSMLLRSEKLAALGKVASGLAHEIRNPLTAIKMLIYSLKKEVKLNSDTEKDFEIIFNEIDRMENFLQNFLDFARPRNPNYDQINIADTLQQTILLLTPQIRAANIRLSDDIRSDGIKIFADREQLRQVFINIILNAVQAMANGGLFEISTRLLYDLAGSPTDIQIVFNDTGSGIPPDIIGSIFDPFITGRKDGTGLGLSIVHRIISNHGGWIDAVNNPEKGACFTIKLPVSKG
ncbi:MCP four helix bundle domain-containing protein [bacterium]|nr:MCP four helix bundle domain-containing protein [bacterium]MBU1064198.1 MCP four helix bundle domain-containing protein [bacterium]MBU1633731.1 MCP four helix bundle domain-containing protein [bacterium]MBU1874351.1 MCP four helix bundle domain-containing protein [bacterium]